MDELFGFLDPFIEGEREYLQTEYRLTKEGAESASELLRKRLVQLTEPLVLKIYNEELQRIAPASLIDPFFAGEEQRKEAKEAVKRRLSGSGALFLAYPELEGYRQRICGNFRQFMDSFFNRLSENKEEIGRKLLGGNPVGELLSLSTSGADCHLHGCCALRVSTEGGTFYYKPRDLGPDEMFERLAGRFFEGRIYAPRILKAGKYYGFIEAIWEQALEKEEDIHAYFQNFGILLSLFRSLGSNDMHYENIVASGVFPVCIDLETIMTPVYRPLEGTDYKSIEQMDELLKDIFFSTANTMVLPMMLQGRLQMSPLLEKGARCLPRFQGEQRDFYGYENDIFSGFGEGYDTIEKNREEILSLLQEYTDTASRFVLRASSYYALTLQEMHSEAFLKEPAKKEQELCKLKERLKNLSAPDAEALTRWERESLEEGDIPFFSLKSGERSLYGAPEGEALVKDFFTISALEHARLCLSHMGSEEKRFELEYLRTRLRQAADKAAPEAFKEESESHGSFRHGLSEQPFSTGNDRQLTAEEAVHLSEGLLRDLLELKVTSAHGQPFFLSYDINLAPQCLPGLINGMQGMAFFFEELEKSVPNCRDKASELMELCYIDTERVVRFLGQYEPEMLGRNMLGLGNGIGGILLSPALSRDGAKRLVSYIYDDVLRACTRNTLEEGLAGLLVGLAFWQRRGLLTEENGIVPYITDQLLHADTAQLGAGLMRGKAGLCLALSLCEELAKDQKQGLLCRKRREELLSEIKDEYSESLMAWPDRERLDRPLFPVYDLEKGAPGIGLSAAFLLKADPPALQGLAEELLKLSAESVCKGTLLPTDTILQGNAGTALFLLEAAEALGEKEYLASAGRILFHMSERARENGGFRVLDPRYKNVPDPSFLMGYAGIGYVLLRYMKMV